MKTNLHFKLFLIGTFFISLVAKSQSDNTGYAVTDSITTGIKWNFLRTVDIKTGNYSDTLVRLLSINELLPNNGITPWNGVAAIAHDKKNKRIYFTSLLLDKLSYVDLRSMTVHVALNNFTGLLPKQMDQSNIITRMVIADDGYGYALTNDGNHLVQFTTGNTHIATDLGSIADAPVNKENSIHNTCGSWGGDMISDDEGNLYLVTFRNFVFKINIELKVATYLGAITGLPDNFSTSGLAVNKQGNDYYFILASSVNASSAFKLNPASLVATPVNQNNGKFTADLSNSTIFKTGKQQVNPKMIVNTISGNDNIQIYPNPVVSNEFKIQFANTKAGNYTVELVDVNGKIITAKSINITGKNNLVQISLKGIVAKGFFVLRIVGKNNNTLYSDKLILQ